MVREAEAGSSREREEAISFVCRSCAGQEHENVPFKGNTPGVYIDKPVETQFLGLNGNIFSLYINVELVLSIHEAGG